MGWCKHCAVWVYQAIVESGYSFFREMMVLVIDCHMQWGTRLIPREVTWHMTVFSAFVVHFSTLVSPLGVLAGIS